MNEEKKNAVQRKSDDVRNEALNTILELMEKDGLSWRKGWSSPIWAPYNAVSGRRYKGSNIALLGAAAVMKGYDDPRWVTIGQAKKLCNSARASGEEWTFKGEKCTTIECWKPIAYPKRDANGEAVLDENGNQVVGGTYMKLTATWPVLNMSQIKGAPRYEPQGKDPLPVADRLIETSECPVHETMASDRAFYSPMLDEVTVPSRTQFADPLEFTSTLAHEMTHSTGHPSRLNRELSCSKGDEKYAFEELVAELGSVFTCAQLGLTYEPDDERMENHAAYLKSWMKSLKSEKGADVLFNAAALASQAADMIVGNYGLEEPKTFDLPEIAESKPRLNEKKAA